MPAGQQGHQQTLDHRLLADNAAGDLLENALDQFMVDFGLGHGRELFG